METNNSNQNFDWANVSLYINGEKIEGIVGIEYPENIKLKIENVPQYLQSEMYGDVKIYGIDTFCNNTYPSCLDKFKNDLWNFYFPNRDKHPDTNEQLDEE